MLRNILGPFGYLKIKHDFKTQIDWILPLFLSVVTILLFFAFDKNRNINFINSGSIVERILNFTQILPGFYIAALAAIATFQKNDIDQAMPSPAPKIVIEVKGKKVPSDLSRRRFLCSMFAFLTAESLLIIFLCLFGLNILSLCNDFFKENYWIYLYFSILIFAVWQMVIATFWGLFYLGDRLHRD